MALHTVAACAGIGGIELGLSAALPETFVPVLYCERELAAAAIIAKNIETGRLPAAPIWSDLWTLCDPEVAGYLDPLGVDFFTAGFPCQPFSQAGSRNGTEDPRHLWPAIVRFVRRYRPAGCFFENVPGLDSTRTIRHNAAAARFFERIDAAARSAETPRERWRIAEHRKRLYDRILGSHGVSSLLYVCGELESLGYTVAAGIFSAAETGASHKRERVFILGMADDQIDGRGKISPGSPGATGHAAGDGPDVADGRDSRSQGDEQTGTTAGATRRSGGTGLEYSDSSGRGRKSDGGEQANGITAGGNELENAEHERTGEGTRQIEPAGVRRDLSAITGLPVYPPGPGDFDEWRGILERFPELAPAMPDGNARRREILEELDIEHPGPGAKSGNDSNGYGSPQETEPAVRGVADGFSRVEQLRAYGNAVVPGCAAVAFLSLFAGIVDARR